MGRLIAKRIFTAPPELRPMLIIETQKEIKELSLPADDHFQKMLNHFHALVSEKSPPIEEYAHNILQAKLIEDFKNKANVL